MWDAASAGTRVLIFTADGQLFRTYTGLPGSDTSFDLGVRSIEWSPVSSARGVSEVLAVGKVDGSVDLLKSTTVRLTLWSSTWIGMLTKPVFLLYDSFARLPG